MTVYKFINLKYYAIICIIFMIILKVYKIYTSTWTIYSKQKNVKMKNCTKMICLKRYVNMLLR